MRADIVQMLNIDMKAQIFTARVRLEFSWLDPELAEAKQLGLDVSKFSDDRERGSRADGYWRFNEASVANLADEENKSHLLKKKWWAPRLMIRNIANMSEDKWWMKCYDSAGGTIVCSRWELTSCCLPPTTHRPCPR